jgi:transcriptional regulator with XRE-family HTH domain
MANASMIASSLGGYLRARRALVTPAAALLAPTGRRRVPGLRREEVAELAGLSTDYYVRLEHGRADRPSAAVLDALSRALLLGPAERAHLHDLARSPARPAGRAAPAGRDDALRPALRQVVEAIVDSPAVIMNDRTDVLAWNRLAAVLIADFPSLPPRERTMARRIFLDPAAREVHADWDEAARTTVGILRMAGGRRPHDRELARLVGELSMGSAAFAALWASHHVHEKTHGLKRFRHPAVGEVTLRYETLGVPGPAHHLLTPSGGATPRSPRSMPDEPANASAMLVIYTAPPGSPAAEALGFLASFAGP